MMQMQRHAAGEWNGGGRGGCIYRSLSDSRSAARVRLSHPRSTHGRMYLMLLQPLNSFLSQKRQVSSQFIDQLFCAADANAEILEAVAVGPGCF